MGGWGTELVRLGGPNDRTKHAKTVMRENIYFNHFVFRL
jgi:hypothetical protein